MENISAVILLLLRLLMAVALYAFLGWCFYILWRDLRTQAQGAARHRVPGVTLALAGVNGAADEILRFAVPEITIGRHPSCEWMLVDETVSSRHARLSYHHDQWWLEDLTSRNGTFLNGEPLSEPVVLTENDQVRCGQVDFTVVFDEVLNNV